jgi:hypothetical protein
MNPTEVVVRGTLKEDGTLELDEKPELPPGRVQVTLRHVPEAAPGRPGWWEVLQQIWKDQEARGYKGRTKEEIDAEIDAERAEEEEYEERWRQIWSQAGSPPSPKEP